jgi:glycosyltransferase involved in cell wall biosynthesis
VKLVNETGLEHKITFLQHIANMSEFYNNQDVFIHCSTIPEPFGLVVAEAMAHGCLVIGSNEGGVTDLLKMNETGLTFSSTKASAIPELTSIMDHVMRNDPESLRKMASNGHRLISEEYNVETMREQLEDIYSDLI